MNPIESDNNQNLYQTFLLFARCEAEASGKTRMSPGLEEGALRLVREAGILYPAANGTEEVKIKWHRNSLQRESLGQPERRGG